MSLLLVIENMDRLDNGEPVQLRLDRHGAIIGRSPHSDWSLPDPKNYVSSTHCEIDFRDGGYVLIDKSTNGTMLNGSTQRMAGPHKLEDGDVIGIGHYRIRASTAGGKAAAAAPAPAQGKSGWSGWDDLPGTGRERDPAPPSAGWGAPTPAAASGAWGDAPAPAQSSAWADAPSPPPAPPPAADAWGKAAPASGGWDDAPPAKAAWTEPAPAAAPAATTGAWTNSAAHAPVKSGWDPFEHGGKEADPWAGAPASAMSGRGPMAQSWAPPSTVQSQAPDDVWGRFAASNTVDWARSGFDQPDAPPALPPPAPAPAAAAAVAAAPVAAPAQSPGPGIGSDAAWSAFLAASGVSPDLLKGSPTEAASAAGGLLKRLVAGLMVMMEARARAKSQLGAQSTSLELGGNNPIKFARSPDRLLAQMLSAPERGFMDANQAVEDSFHDLQAHQMATLAAMQGALRSTLDRFSPQAISARAETRGLLAKILPSARNAALWDAYQKEFDGVARGSDEAFLDVFAKAFKAAYEQASAEMKRGGR